MYSQQYVSTVPSSHRGRSSYRAPYNVPSSQFAPAFPTPTTPGTPYSRRATMTGYPAQVPAQTFYVARSPSRRDGHHRSHSHAGHRHSSTTRSHGHHHHRSQSVTAHRHHHEPSRTHSVHYVSHHPHTLADRIRKFFGIGPWSHHGKRYVNSRGQEVDRSGRRVTRY